MSAVTGIAWSPYCAVVRGFENREPRVLSCTVSWRPKARSDFAITNGARLMLSTPPAMNRSPWPQATARDASTTAASPLAQSRLTVIPATSTGSPASSPARRATFRQSSPAWLVQPAMTSSTSSGRNGLRAIRVAMGPASRSSGRTGARAPAWRPNGVRTPS